MSINQVQQAGNKFQGCSTEISIKPIMMISNISKTVEDEEKETKALCSYSLRSRQQLGIIRRRVNLVTRRNFPLAFKCASLSGESSLIFHLVVALTLITLLTVQAVPVKAVDCFKCNSRNGSNPACEDPFHNVNTTRITSPILPDHPPNVVYHTPCYAGKKGREGLFPASACIKLTGVFDTTGETLVVRHCALDSGTLTQDTELARMSHCGKFQFEGDLLSGCVQACPEDACNSAPTSVNLSTKLQLLAITSLIVALSMYGAHSMNVDA